MSTRGAVVSGLKARRSELAEEMAQIDAVLKGFGATATKQRRGSGTRSEAAKKMWATRRKNAKKPEQSSRPRLPGSTRRAVSSGGASLAAAAE